jgi:3-deoxy-D-manno-octulosonic-acid transferase
MAGSTWKEDEEALQKILNKLNEPNLKLVIAPHEIDVVHLEYLEKLFPTSIKFSTLAAGESTRLNDPKSNILVIDNIGMLSRLYKYAYVSYVGGGFTKDGVHNVLEAAVYGKPVVFARNYKKYREAIDLVDCSGAKAFTDAKELQQILITLLHSDGEYRRRSLAAKKYIEENVGATKKILNYIEEKRLLTS